MLKLTKTEMLVYNWYIFLERNKKQRQNLIAKFMRDRL